MYTSSNQKLTSYNESGKGKGGGGGGGGNGRGGLERREGAPFGRDLMWGFTAYSWNTTKKD